MLTDGLISDWPGILWNNEPITSVSSFCGLLWEELKSWRRHRGGRSFSFSLIRHGSRLGVVSTSVAQRCAAIRRFSLDSMLPRRVAT
jgi:hypothetical protein